MLNGLLPVALMLLSFEVGYSQDAVTNFLNAPTRANSRKILQVGIATEDALIKQYETQTDKNVKLLLLKTIVALPGTSQKRSALYGRISQSLVVDPLQKMTASFADMLDHPYQPNRLNDFLKAGVVWDDFDFSFYGTRGLALLEALLYQAKNSASDDVIYLSNILRKDFPRDANEYFQVEIKQDLLTLFDANTDPQTAKHLMARLCFYIESIDQTSQRDIFDLILAKADLPTFSMQENHREQLLSHLLLTMDSLLTEDRLDALRVIYIDVTKLPVRNESDAYFIRLRSSKFLRLINEMQELGGSFRHNADALVLKNIQIIMGSDQPNHRQGVKEYISKMENPYDVILNLVKSDDPKIIVEGFAAIRAVPRSKWDHSNKQKVEIQNRLVEFSRGSIFKDLEKIRIGAEAVKAHLQHKDYAVILQGAQFSSVAERLDSLNVIEELEAGGPEVLALLQEIIRSDPDLMVRAKVMDLIYARLSGTNYLLKNELLTNFSVAEVVANSVSHDHKLLADKAKKVLISYLSQSAHGDYLAQRLIASDQDDLRRVGLDYHRGKISQWMTTNEKIIANLKSEISESHGLESQQIRDKILAAEILEKLQRDLK